MGDLNAKICAFVNGWDDRAHPIVCTKTADEILNTANRQTTRSCERASACLSLADVSAVLCRVIRMSSAHEGARRRCG